MNTTPESKIIQINMGSIKAAYSRASEEGKKLLADLFGQENMPQKITDRVQTFNDVLDIAGIAKEAFFSSKDEDEDETAYRQVKLIAEIYNEGVVLDPMNTNQYKYYPWHRIDKNSGVGLSFYGVDYWSTHSAVGVRLCFATAELAEDAGRKFLDIYAALKIK